MPTWKELVTLEPGLALLEHEILKVQDWPERPYFCANAYWYGRGRLKSELERLVGWGRRGVRVVTDLHEGEEDQMHLKSGTDVLVRTATYDSILAQIQADEDKEGLGLLWTSEAYSVAYEFLYAVLPDCRHEGPCQ